LLENLLQTVIVTTVKGQVLFINKTGEALTGYTAMELLGRNVNVLMPEPYHSEHDNYLKAYLDSGIPKIIGSGRDVVVRQKCGLIVPANLTITEQGKGDDRIFTGVLIPIDEVHDTKASLALQKSSYHPTTNTTVISVEEFLEQQRQVLSLLLVAAVVIDEKGTVRVWNETSEKLFGWKREEIEGKNVRKIMPSPDRDNHDRYLKRYLKTGKSRVLGIGRDVVGMTKDGGMVPLKLSVFEQRNKQSADKERFFIGNMQNTS